MSVTAGRPGAHGAFRSESDDGTIRPDSARDLSTGSGVLLGTATLYATGNRAALRSELPLRTHVIPVSLQIGDSSTRSSSATLRSSFRRAEAPPLRPNHRPGHPAILTRPDRPPPPHDQSDASVQDRGGPRRRRPSLSTVTATVTSSAGRSSNASGSHGSRAILAHVYLQHPVFGSRRHQLPRVVRQRASLCNAWQRRLSSTAPARLSQYGGSCRC